MPTIDELIPAPVAADEDFLPVSQAGSMRRVTRSQLLAGMQPALAVAAGSIVGRSSPGLGAPEAISVGANLTLRDGVLSAPTAYAVGALPTGTGVGPSDLVAISQGGRDASLPVGLLLAGLSQVPGLDLSSQAARVAGGPLRPLSDWLGDAVAVEAFGAVGDGVTDDTAAIDRAVASGRPVRFGPRTYVLNGQWTVTGAALLLGVAGRTVLKRVLQAGGAWINAAGPRFAAIGVVFDAGTIGGESWGVLVAPTCTQTLFEGCVFKGASGAMLGSGLVIQARDGRGGTGASQHVVRGCEASGNAAHGIWVQAACGAVIEGCLAHDNGAYGICLDFNDPTFQNLVRHGEVRGCRAWGNGRGISVGNYNETNAEPPRWGNGNPDAIGVVVSGNRCHDNRDHGIAVSGRAMQVVGNLVEGNACGVLLNATSSVVAGNVIRGPGQFGIDAGGCVGCTLEANQVEGFAVGINPGGSENVRVHGNTLAGNVWGITVYGMETDGHGVPFGIACTGLGIEGNRIQLKDGSGGGIFLIDAPQNVLVAGNAFLGGDESRPSQAVWAHTDQYAIRDNSWNHQARLICNPIAAGGLAQVQVPDALDGAMLTSAPQGVGSIIGQHQASMAGRVAFVRVSAGGSGYTWASVTVAGSGADSGADSGAGASAVAYVRDGAVVGIAVTDGGSGYGAGTSVSIAGDGQGARAAATVGLPVPDGRRMRLHCNGPVRFQRVGSAPFQDNWTGTDFLVPPASVVEWVGAWGGWHAVAFPPADYLAPAGDGSLVVRSLAGDIVSRPSGAGRVRVSSDAEPVGYASLLGRGSPEGAVVAPPGSDYRNLDGGAGTSLWIKRSGVAATGWFAVA